MTKRQGVRFAAFALLCVLTLSWLSYFLRERDTLLAGFYSEPENTVDVLLVGSSHANCTFIPGVLWKEYGISSHNVYSWDQTMWISYYYIKEALRTQNPSAVVLDLYGMMYGNTAETPTYVDDSNYKNAFKLDASLNSLAMTQTVATCGEDRRNPVDFLPLVRYHTRWKFIDENFFLYDAHKQKSYLKGYLPRIATQSCHVPAPAEGLTPQEPYPTAVKWLDKIVKLCRNKGLQLVFTMTPYQYTEKEQPIFAWLAEYAKENGIPFLNYCDVRGKQIGFDFTTQMYNAGHVNPAGGLVVTRDLGKFLKASCKLQPPEENPARDEHDHAAESFYRMMWVVDHAPKESAQFVSWLAQQSKDYTIMITANSKLTGLPDAFKNACRGLGLTQIEAVFHTPDTSYLAVLDDGKVYEEAGDELLQKAVACGDWEFELKSNGGATNASDIYQNGESKFPAQNGLRILLYDKIMKMPTIGATYDADTKKFTMIHFEIPQV
ncbi:MAG: hypothetical protein RSG59_00325 [Ruthenibacterium sp.]